MREMMSEMTNIIQSGTVKINDKLITITTSTEIN